MWSRINNWLTDRRAKSAKTPQNHPRRLTFQPLESRDLMAGIPALSSLPGAPHTIYLDFDGDFQSVWNRTDSNQQYTNVSAGEFNIDNTPGISDAEASAIQKIWETTADDYAPFNVNVTTVAPSSFANGVALRVVMAGDCTATLKTGANSSINVSGDRFISDNSGNLVDTSGYSAIGSFNNSEPNVVYVFAKYMSTWGNVDSEGHIVDLRAMIGTTASHEAGHAFGLVHHGDYDVGTSITTPIMGSNTQGDRTIWSTYQVGSTTHNNITELTNKLGARADDVANSYSSAPQFKFSTYSTILGYRGSAHGFIGTTSDVDMFKLTITAADTYNFSVSVPQFGDLDSQLFLYRVTKLTPFAYKYQTIATADPLISSIQPFQGLGASLSAFLQAGTYALAVKSHGGFGDLGNYTLSGNHGGMVIVFDPPLVAAMSAGAGESLTTRPELVKQTTTTKSSRLAGGQGAGPALAGFNTEKSTPPRGKSQLDAYTLAVDSIFESLGNKLTQQVV